LDKGFLISKGTSYQFGEVKIGTKAILKNDSSINELRAQLIYSTNRVKNIQ